MTLRQTGRTTRLLARAVQLSTDGRAVYIIAANHAEVVRLRSLLGDDDHGIKIETPESPGNVNWSTLTLRGAHPNCVVLVDHYAIESRFSAVLEMLHAFDAPSAVTYLLAACKAVLDPNPCQLDHHGNCQAHGLDNPCGQKLLREAIDKVTGA